MKPLSPCEANWIERLRSYVKRADCKLTDWERGFCRDLFDRFDTFGKNTILNGKQWEIIHRITDKVIR